MIYTDVEPVNAGCVNGVVEAAAGCEVGRDEVGKESKAPDAFEQVAGRAESMPAECPPSQAKPPATVREFERALRGLGFTRAQAQAIARHGFGAMQAPSCPDPTPDEHSQLAAALQSLAASLKD